MKLGAPALGRDFKHDAMPAGAAGYGGAVDIAGSVESYVGIGLGAVEAGEAVKHRVGPGAVGGMQLEDDAAVTGRISPSDGGAIKISRCVHHHTAAGVSSFGRGLDVVQNVVFPLTAGRL